MNNPILQTPLTTRQIYFLLAMSLLLLALFLVAATHENAQQTSRWLLTRTQSERTGNGRQYRLMVAVLRAPLNVRRLWEFSFGDAYNDNGFRAYHDGYAMYVRLGVRISLPRSAECIAESAGREIPLPCS